MHRKGVLTATIDFKENEHPDEKLFYMPSINGPVQNCPHGLKLKIDLKGPIRCQYCNAKLFPNETSNLCCANGQIVCDGKSWQMKPMTPAPQLIRDILGDPESAVYRDPFAKRNIRKYNNGCAMV